MRTQTLAAGLIAASFAALVPVQTRAQSQTLNPARVTRPVITKQSVQASTAPAVTFPRAPDLVGLGTSEAYAALTRIGLTSKIAYVDTIDDSIPYNHVGATIPAAGGIPGDGIVTLQVPRPPALSFTGALSVIDIIRRDGFDLDQGRYEQVLRGADMVLREDKTSIPHQDPNGGSTYYTTKGLFVEPSDGAVFAKPGSYGVSTDQYPGGLGAAPNYTACQMALNGPRSAYFNLPTPGYYGEDLVFCVLTSSRQIAVVHFRKGDIDCCGKDNYKFYIAVFPRQKTAQLRIRKEGIPRIQ